MKAENPKPAPGETQEDLLQRILMVLAVLVPLVLLLVWSGGLRWGTFWFWLAVLLAFWVIWAFFTGAEPAETTSDLRMLHEAEQPALVRDLMDVRLAMEEKGVQTFRGRLREPAEAVFQKLKTGFVNEAVPLLEEDQKLGAAIVLVPKAVEGEKFDKPVRPAVHWALLLLTFLTTTWAGAAHQGVNLLHDPDRFAVGLPYSIGLLAILGVHELGHYFAARFHHMKVTPPFFIPMPFALGTFGAFIRIRSPVENRRALFDVAVAGPLAGLVVAIPALLIGLKSSLVIPGTPSALVGGTSVDSSFLFAMLAKLALPEELQFGHVLRLSPLAFAGWLGLLITGLNLLPIGQLDGGHAARALLGNRLGNRVSTVAMWSLLLLAIFRWPGLILFALVVFFLARHAEPPLDDLTPLTFGRQWIGYVTFIILAMILTPLPHSLWRIANIHCPYL